MRPRVRPGRRRRAAAHPALGPPGLLLAAVLAACAAPHDAGGPAAELEPEVTVERPVDAPGLDAALAEDAVGGEASAAAEPAPTPADGTP